MKKLNAIIERNEDSFFAYIEQIEGCVSGGQSYSEVKQNLEMILQLLMEEDEDLAAEYKNGFAITFKVNLESVFDLIPEINISQLAKSGRINPGLLRQYVSGTKKASEKQAQKIMMTIQKLSKKLDSILLTA